MINDMSHGNPKSPRRCGAPPPPLTTLFVATMATTVATTIGMLCISPALAFAPPVPRLRRGGGGGGGGITQRLSSSSSRWTAATAPIWTRTRTMSPPLASTTSVATEEGKTSDAKSASSSSDDEDDRPPDHMPELHSIAKVVDPITTTALEKYRSLHAESIAHPAKFWSKQAKDLLTWYTPFDPHRSFSGGFEHGDVTFFAGGKLNVCYNAIDRHASRDSSANDIAMIWEGDESTDVKRYTYADLLRKVSQIANALKTQGVKKGDVVTIYMPMIAELPLTMLACARIGAVHSVVFAGFSAEALASRIEASGSEYVVTADQGVRGTKVIPLKSIVDEALAKQRDGGTRTVGDQVKKVFVYERYYGADVDDAEQDANAKDVASPSSSYEMHPNKDVRMDPLVEAQRPYCPCEPMDAEDPLFILYTSGSTGTPKGLVHTTGGYATYAAFTTQTTFDLKKNDVFACVADCGWVTGHTYVTYGPLLNGGTTVVFESTPMYPDAGRYWDLIQRHKVTAFYTAPTAIRSLMRYGDSIPKRYDLSSLRVLGTVGEPINPEAWRWYHEVVGKGKCTVVDTYWQTETGGHIFTNLPGITPMKPGSCALPCYGIDAVVLDPLTGEVLEGNDVKGVLAVRQPWPGMARTCLGDHGRFLSTYLKPYPGYYFTGDAVYRDEDGYHFITGRVDDVINVSGHRIGTAEVESALVLHPAVAQAAVVARPHPIKGQSICAFATLTVGYEEEEDELVRELRQLVRGDIGPFASPDIICLTPGLPMTRSGKIMRRVLRKIVAGEADQLGDTSTLADPSIVDTLIDKVCSSSKS